MGAVHRFLHDDNKVSVVVPAGGCVAGTPLKIGSLFGIPETTQDAAELASLLTRGYVKLPKGAVAIAAGVALYWDAENAQVDARPLGQFVGVCSTAALSGDAKVKCLLVPGMHGTSKRVAVGVLDASAGLAVGAHTFGPEIPDNAVIDRAWYDVLTTFQSATDAATIALGIETDDDECFVAATAISAGGNIYDAGLQATLMDAGQIATAFKTAGARQLVATVAVEALTAGKLVVVAEYTVTE